MSETTGLETCFLCGTDRTVGFPPLRVADLCSTCWGAASRDLRGESVERARRIRQENTQLSLAGSALAQLRWAAAADSQSGDADV